MIPDNVSHMSKTPSLKNFLHGNLVEAGCDEAGRGPLAGSVFAAAVILPPDFHHPLLNDSKQMTAAHRDIVREVIEKEAVSWAVEEVLPEEIDRINILWASVTGMQRAVLRLDPEPDFLLIDGNRFRPFGRYGAGDYLTVVKGDATYASIAAASVLAKTWRDEYMRKIAREFPQYGWDRNMGYPTPEHIAAIRKYGYTPYHRMSFHPKELEPTLF
jgi:ribonuclease HII